MPIYEYLCLKCNRPFATLQKIGSAEKDTRCPDCGSNDVKKTPSAFSCSPGDVQSSYTPPRRFGGG